MPHNPSTHAATFREEKEPPSSLLAWWLLSFVLLIAAASPRLLPRTSLFPSGETASLSPPGIWHAPLARIGVLKPYLAIPNLVVAVAGGLVIALIARYAAIRIGFWTGFLAAVALSCGIREIHLIPAALLFGMTIQFEGKKSEVQQWRSLVGIALLAMLSVLISLEFGFLLLFGLCLVIPRLSCPLADGNPRPYLYLLGGLLLAASLGCLLSGFREVLFRPLNWWMVDAYRGLLDTLMPAISLDGVSWQHGFALIVIGMVWFDTAQSVSRLRKSLLCLLIFSSLGTLCSYYLWLSTIAILLGCSREQLFPGHKRVHSVAFVVVLFLGILQLARSGTASREYLLKGTIPARRIDPSEWSLSGPMILLDLDRSNEWQDLGSDRQHPLLLDDRWEVFQDQYAEYAALVRDLREMRALIYWRTDNHFGGYLHQLKPWEPSLVVAESEDLDAVRNLSLSPHWKLMGIDAQTTIFGRAENPDIQPQIRNTGDLLLTLEWPNDSSPIFQQNVIAASTPAELRRVAAVLAAIRLPYASMRLLPEGNSVENRKIEAWCYLELAHRTFRNTGAHSLIDSFRAISLIRQLNERNQWSPPEVARLTRAVRGLGIPGLAEEIFPATGVEESGASLQSVPPDSQEESSSSEFGGGERALREQILRGRNADARLSIEQLPAEQRPFYETILSSTNRSREDIAKELYGISESRELPERLRMEALFYLGCVAIEFGDRDVAINSLSRSEQLASESHWSPLRSLYLKQLRRP